MKQFGVVGAMVCCCAPSAMAFFSDPGFESYAVASGDWVRNNGGPWSFFQDASVVEPFAPNSSTGVLSTWSATFAPKEGEQYASTYAGGDTITQSVLLQPGEYTVSVWAAAPDGQVTIPLPGGNDQVSTLVTGAFEFTVNGVAVSVQNGLAPGTDWTFFSATFTAGGAGLFDIGVRNTVIASYFINYDEFGLVPAPGVGVVMMVGAGGLLRRRRG